MMFKCLNRQNPKHKGSPPAPKSSVVYTSQQSSLRPAYTAKSTCPGFSSQEKMVMLLSSYHQEQQPALPPFLQGEQNVLQSQRQQLHLGALQMGLRPGQFPCPDPVTEPIR